MCRPDGRHVLNNQGTDDYVLTNFLFSLPDHSWLMISENLVSKLSNPEFGFISWFSKASAMPDIRIL